MRITINILLTFTLLLTVSILTGCSKRVPYEEMDAEEAYRYLKERYDQGKYLDASDGLDYYTLNFSGSSLVDSAQFLLGQSHFKMKEYLLAADSFEELYRRFPSSILVPEAMYMVGVCYWELSPKYSLDQRYTSKSLDALQAFIDYFPDHTERVAQAQELIEVCREKLAHKEYANGVIYLKMNDYKAAIIYFLSLLDNYYDTEWAPMALYQLGIAYFESERFTESEETCLMFLDKYPGHSLQSKVETVLKNMRRKLAEETEG